LSTAADFHIFGNHRPLINSRNSKISWLIHVYKNLNVQDKVREISFQYQIPLTINNMTENCN